MSQSEFARRLAIARTTVHNWESARNKPDEEAMLEVCRILGTSVSFLWGQTDDPRPAPDWHTDKGASSADEVARREAMEHLRLAIEKLGRPR